MLVTGIKQIRFSVRSYACIKNHENISLADENISLADENKQLKDACEKQNSDLLAKNKKLELDLCKCRTLMIKLHSGYFIDKGYHLNKSEFDEYTKQYKYHDDRLGELNDNLSFLKNVLESLRINQRVLTPVIIDALLSMNKNTNELVKYTGLLFHELSELSDLIIKIEHEMQLIENRILQNDIYNRSDYNIFLSESIKKYKEGMAARYRYAQIIRDILKLL